VKSGPADSDNPSSARGGTVRRRSNLLVIIGLVTFVLGLLAVYVVTSEDDDDTGGTATGAGTVEVLVATELLTAGARGDDVIADGGVATERINRADLQPDALLTQSQLSNTVLTLNFADGEQIRSSGLRTLGGVRPPIPEGFEAVAVDIGLVAAGANTIIPGDRVNVYLVAPDLVTGAGTTAEGETVAFPSAPRTELLLTNTLVLDVQPGPAPLTVSQAPDPALAATAPTNGTLIVVLALETTDAEKVIFSSTATGLGLYLSRVPLDEDGNGPTPSGPTTGVDAGTVLTEEADTAFTRTNG
jgi:Flp pilus assembly protein CpaB